MDNRDIYSRNGACDNYSWSAYKFCNKLIDNFDIVINLGLFSITLKSSKPNNSDKVAYRCCANCEKHFNYHKKYDNTYKYKLFNTTTHSYW